MNEQQRVPEMMNYPVFVRINREPGSLIEMGVFVVKARRFGKADHYMSEYIWKQKEILDACRHFVAYKLADKQKQHKTRPHSSEIA